MPGSPTLGSAGRPTAPGGPEAKRGRLLIVEDDPATLDTFARILVASGYEVLTATDVASALQAVAETVPDAVLLDIHLPTASGLAFLRQVRATVAGRHVPVAAVTADYFLDEAVAAELQALGAQVYFKPLWEEDLQRVAAELLRRR